MTVAQAEEHETASPLTAARGAETLPRANLAALIDSHVHLAWRAFAGDLDDVVKRAVANGVERMLAVGIDEASSVSSIEVAERYAGVFASAGLHPNDCAGLDSQFPAIAALARLRHHQHGGRVVAIGESGLDFYRADVLAAIQVESFSRHLALAADLDLPIIVHNRQADETILGALDGAPAGVRGVMHCFSSDRAFAEASLERGFYLSFAGNLTYRSAAVLRDVAATVPSDRLLVETDAPFLPPQPWRGKRNEPAYVAETLRVLCDIRGVDEVTLADQIAANARALFRW